jgi:hypothetical protein
MSETLIKNYEKACGELNFIVSLGAKTGILLNDQLLGMTVNTDILKNILSYHTSLGLLNGYAHLLEYQLKLGGKKLKTDDPDVIKKQQNTIFEITTQCHVLLGALVFFTRVIKTNMVSLPEIKKHMTTAIESLEKKHLPLITPDTPKESGKKSKSNISGAKAPKTTRGGGGILEDLKTGGFSDAIIGSTEICIGGSDIPMLGGIQAAHGIRKRNIKLSLLKHDFEGADEGDSNAFMATLAGIVNPTGSSEESNQDKSEEYVQADINTHENILEKLDKKLKLQPQALVQESIRDHNISKVLKEQYKASLEKIPIILEYYYGRIPDIAKTTDPIIKNIKDGVTIEYKDKWNNLDIKLEWNPDMPIESVKILVGWIDKLMKAIHTSDVKRSTRTIKTDFETISKLEKSGDISKIVDETIADAKTILEAQIALRERHNSKITIASKISELTGSTKPIIPKTIIAPAPTKTLKENKLKKNTIERVEHFINSENALKPAIVEQENFMDRQAIMLGELMKLILDMISPENTSTCIKKCIKLVNTIVRTVVLEKISNRAPKANFTELKKIQKELEKTFPGPSIEFYNTVLDTALIQEWSSLYC